MPSSREVRARQNRQRERIAAAHAERRRVQRRRRLISAVLGVVVVAVLVVVVLKLPDNTSTVAVSPTSSTTAAVKRCAGLQDKLPKGAPAMPLAAGPAPTSLVTRDLKVGTGAVVPPKSKITVNYVGVACSTGKIFDSSYSRNQPIPIDLNGGVIKGWVQGVPGMKVGGVRLLSIPASLAYGPNPPTGSGIGPDEPLIFLVAVVKIG